MIAITKVTHKVPTETSIPLSARFPVSMTAGPLTPGTLVPVEDISQSNVVNLTNSAWEIAHATSNEFLKRISNEDLIEHSYLTEPAGTPLAQQNSMGRRAQLNDGTVAWVFTPGSYATTPAGDPNTFIGTGFGFNIPGNAIVKGIVVEVTFNSGVGNGELDTVQLVRGGTLYGQQKTALALLLTGVTHSVGGSTDMWGVTWTPEVINDPSFGVGLGIVGNGDTCSEDTLEITVYYEEPGWDNFKPRDYNLGLSDIMLPVPGVPGGVLWYKSYVNRRPEGEPVNVDKGYVFRPEGGRWVVYQRGDLWNLKSIEGFDLPMVPQQVFSPHDDEFLGEYEYHIEVGRNSLLEMETTGIRIGTYNGASVLGLMALKEEVDVQVTVGVKMELRLSMGSAIEFLFSTYADVTALAQAVSDTGWVKAWDMSYPLSSSYKMTGFTWLTLPVNELQVLTSNYIYISPKRFTGAIFKLSHVDGTFDGPLRATIFSSLLEEEIAVSSTDVTTIEAFANLISASSTVRLVYTIEDHFRQDPRWRPWDPGSIFRFPPIINKSESPGFFDRSTIVLTDYPLPGYPVTLTKDGANASGLIESWNMGVIELSNQITDLDGWNISYMSSASRYVYPGYLHPVTFRWHDLDLQTIAKPQALFIMPSRVYLRTASISRELVNVYCLRHMDADRFFTYLTRLGNNEFPFINQFSADQQIEFEDLPATMYELDYAPGTATRLGYIIRPPIIPIAVFSPPHQGSVQVDLLPKYPIADAGELPPDTYLLGESTDEGAQSRIFVGWRDGSERREKVLSEVRKYGPAGAVISEHGTLEVE